ncbi:MAG: SpoIIE family protein phosphatase [SAR324 cluster bacterium]|nr:SpoIIE family protein phosphatase [SAR324 cluster bacterium]
MIATPTVSIKNSIAAYLLKVVFSFYFIITIVVTLTHMSAEFFNAKENVNHELDVIADTFSPGISQALWDLNAEQLQTTIWGIIKFPTVVGVKLEDDNGEEIAASGVFIDKNNKIMTALQDGTKKEITTYKGLFSRKFPNLYQHRGKENKLGVTTIYSSTGIVIDKVKLGFLFIVVNSVIKTVALWTLFLWIGRIYLTNPLASLTAVTEQINLDNLENLKAAVVTKGRNELKILEEAFNNMILKLQSSRNKLNELNKTLELKVEERTRQLSEANKELVKKNEIIIQDLMVAERIQKRLFTTYNPPPHLKIATKYIPHSHVSGDIYKIYPYSDNTYNLFLGDSTGHGVAAALSTVMANVILQDERRSSLEEIMGHLNDVFEQHLPSERFMSGILANIDSQGNLKIINAGHAPLIVIPADGSDPVLLEDRGILLGILPNSMFAIQTKEYSLVPGDQVVLYTDGIYERINEKEEIFGLQKLYFFLKENRFNDLDVLLSQLLEHVESYAQGKEIDDDITLIAFEYCG